MTCSPLFESILWCLDPGSILGRKISWRRQWQPTPVLLPGKPHGQRCLVGYSPWGCKESDMTERLHFHFYTLKEVFFFFFLPHVLYFKMGFPCSSAGKESACCAGDPSSVPGLGSSPGEGIGYPLQYSWASLVAQMVKILPAVRETWVWSLGWEDPLMEGMATHGQRSLVGYSAWDRKES